MKTVQDSGAIFWHFMDIIATFPGSYGSMVTFMFLLRLYLDFLAPHFHNYTPASCFFVEFCYIVTWGGTDVTTYVAKF